MYVTDTTQEKRGESGKWGKRKKKVETEKKIQEVKLNKRARLVKTHKKKIERKDRRHTCDMMW